MLKLDLVSPAVRAFDATERAWSAPATRRWIARGLVLAFLTSVGLIELTRLGWLHSVLGHPMPSNHFHAISWTLTLLLLVEVLDLVFGLAGSMSGSIAKQLQIFSLVLLRKTFDELQQFPEPVVVAGHSEAILNMGTQAGGALGVFALLLLFERIRGPLDSPRSEEEVQSFIAFKKVLCLALIASFVIIGALAGVQSLTLVDVDSTLSLRFFELFYTLLIFADIMVVLASMGMDQAHTSVFRNFGFAVVTVSLRLALAAEPPFNALLGLVAAGFALATVAVCRLALRQGQAEAAGQAEEPGQEEAAGLVGGADRAKGEKTRRPVTRRGLGPNRRR